MTASLARTLRQCLFLARQATNVHLASYRQGATPFVPGMPIYGGALCATYLELAQRLQEDIPDEITALEIGLVHRKVNKKCKRQQRLRLYVPKRMRSA